MGNRQDRLKQILLDGDIIGLPERKPPRINLHELRGSIKDHVYEVFKDLGGLEQEFKFNGRWDIVGDKYILELDEELHFNQYRLLTLNSPLYSELKSFPLETYKGMCSEYDNKCLRAGSYGRKWSSESSEKMFGIAQNNGDLSGNGSPRWKQRAFYDFIKDASPLITNISVIRLSINDEVYYCGSLIKLGEILSRENVNARDAAAGINRLIDQRL